MGNVIYASFREEGSHEMVCYERNVMRLLEGLTAAASDYTAPALLKSIVSGLAHYMAFVEMRDEKADFEMFVLDLFLNLGNNGRSAKVQEEMDVRINRFLKAFADMYKKGEDDSASVVFKAELKRMKILRKKQKNLCRKNRKSVDTENDIG